MGTTVKWTDDQLDAIRLRPQKLLVSAAAGSGKTAVLTERIISRLTEPESDADISRMLIVTYTRLASSELRARIGKKLYEAAETAEPRIAKRLMKQYTRLGSARISTIHSFCAELIKRNFHKLSLPAAIRICEEAQATEIRCRLMDQLIEKAYAGQFEPIPDFKEFSDNFVTTKDIGLRDILLKLHQSVMYLADGFSKWEESASLLNSDVPFLQTPWGEIILVGLRRSLIYAEKRYEACRKMLTEYPVYVEKYYPIIDDDMEIIRKLIRAANGRDLQKLSIAIAEAEFRKMPSISKNDVTDEGIYFHKTVREETKKEINGLKKQLLWSAGAQTADEPPILRIMRSRCANISFALSAFLKEFTRIYTEEKRRLGLLDFTDLEQLTYTLLYNKDGSYSELCGEMSRSLDEIYVDEFQDTNPIQNKIFDALATECRIFQVGDIKQSIYGFRGAAPDIFANCRRTYTQYQRALPETENARELSVFLSKNFRSLYPVIRFVNRVFEPIFNIPDDYVSPEQRTPYSEQDHLACGRGDSFSEDGETVRSDLPSVNMMLIGLGDKNEGDDETAALSATEAECRLIANKITELIQAGEKGENIAVVARSGKHISFLEEMLLEQGITASNGKGAPLTEMPEVSLALCILSCITNPHNDVKLAGALRSPVFGITLDELIHIRNFQKKTSLFSALRSYTEEKDFKKGKSFLEFLDRIKRFGSDRTTGGILWQIYKETGFFSIIYDNGKASPTLAASRRANLIKLHSIASQGDTVGIDGIYTFMRRFEQLAETSNAPTASSVTDASTVRFFTSHGSKGLEFKHCFVCGLGHDLEKSGQRDLSSDALCDGELGIATRLRDATGIIKTDTPMRQALSAKMKYSQFEEELRILYVALTRARDNLYVSAAVKDINALKTKARLAAKTNDPTVFARQRLPIEWILTSLYSGDPLPYEILTVTEYSAEDIEYESSDAKAEAVNNETVSDSVSVSELADKLTERFTREYRHSASAIIPAKVSVSKLYPSLLDEDDTEPLYTPNETDDTTEEGQISFDVGERPDDGEAVDNKSPNTLRTPLFILNAGPAGIRESLLEEDKSNDRSHALKPPKKPLTEDATAAEVGTATHLFMQFCDFEFTEKNGIEAEIRRLCEKQFILPYHAELIDQNNLKRFFASKTYKEMRAAKHIRREVRFNTRMPADMFTTDPDLKKQLTDETVLVQGVIDCYYENADGSITLLDYKTDSFPVGMSERTVCNILKKRHSLQLSYYKIALERLLVRPVDNVRIFSFTLGKEISLSIK